MTKVFFAVSPFVDEIEIMGIDGEVYSIKPGKVILLPKINAEVFEKNNWGKIIGIYKDPNPNKVIELKMILAGKDPYKLRSTPSNHQSAPKSPTGLSRFTIRHSPIILRIL